MASTLPDTTPGNWWIAHTPGRPACSLWHAVDTRYDRLVISGSKGLPADDESEDRLFRKGNWDKRARFVNITTDEAEACIAVCELAGPDAWNTHARRFFQ